MTDVITKRVNSTVYNERITQRIQKSFPNTIVVKLMKEDIRKEE